MMEFIATILGYATGIGILLISILGIIGSIVMGFRKKRDDTDIMLTFKPEPQASKQSPASEPDIPRQSAPELPVSDDERFLHYPKAWEAASSEGLDASRESTY